jgi:SAM-dependent methyltransferase
MESVAATHQSVILGREMPMAEVGPLKPYQRLSRFYDLDWSHFALGYTHLVDDLIREMGISRADILELACGTGVLAAELARRGHRLTGVDACPEMIAVARRRMRRTRNRPRLEVRDMREIRFHAAFDLATCTFDAINYVRGKSNLSRVFENVHGALRPGGHFLFDSTTRFLFEDRSRGTFRRDLGGETFFQSCAYDPEARLATTTFRFADGATEVHRQEAYGARDLAPLLEAGGFSVRSIWEDLERRDAAPDAHRIFLLAAKG